MRKMSEIALNQILREFGLPVVIIFWFMFRTEKVIQKMTDAFTEMNATMLKLCEKIEGWEKP